VFAYVPEPGKTLGDVAAYVSRNPDLPEGLIKLNNIPADKPVPTGMPVIVPVEFIDRERAIGEMSKSMRGKILSSLRGKAYATQVERLIAVKPGLRGPGMHGLVPVGTLALTTIASAVSTVVEALLKLIKGVAYAVSFAAGVVHGFFASIWDTVSGIAKMIYDVVDSIISGELRSDIERLIGGLKGLSKAKIMDMIGEWAAGWDKKLNSSSPFIAGHAHGYLTGYVMAEAAMLLLTGGAATELKAAFWASGIGKAVKTSRAFVAAAKVTEKAIEAGGKVAEVVDKVRKSRVGGVVKAADAVITVAGWTAEKIGKTLSLPGDIAVYVIDKALTHAKQLHPFFERIGTLTSRAKRWLFGCRSPCEWEADAVAGTMQQLTNPQIETSARAAQARQRLVDTPTVQRGEDILDIFAEAQAKSSRGARQTELADTYGTRRKPGGAPVPESFEVGNFSHKYAEELIPESVLPRGLEAEFTVKLPDAGEVRLDRVDFANGKIYEIKPNTPSQIEEGGKQIRKYIHYMNEHYPLGGGRRWEADVVTYDKDVAAKVMRKIGWLE
jgi:hypothetical protein